jgi:hypothetical protein
VSTEVGAEDEEGEDESEDEYAIFGEGGSSDEDQPF